MSSAFQAGYEIWTRCSWMFITLQTPAGPFTKISKMRGGHSLP